MSRHDYESHVGIGSREHGALDNPQISFQTKAKKTFPDSQQEQHQNKGDSPLFY